MKKNFERITYYDETLGSFLLKYPKEYEHWDLVNRIGELEDQLIAIIEIINGKIKDEFEGDI